MQSLLETQIFKIERCLLTFLKYFLLVQKMLKELSVCIDTQFHIYTLNHHALRYTFYTYSTPHMYILHTDYISPNSFASTTTHISPLNTCTTQTQSHPCYIYTYNLKYTHHNYTDSTLPQTHHKHIYINTYTLHTCMMYTHDLHVYKPQTHTHT